MNYDYWELQKEFDKWSAVTMPSMKFPADWLVKMVAPFGGAICRFHASLSDADIGVSVYFDTTNALGYHDGPYWEAYPINGNNERFSLGQESELIAAIDKELHGMAD